MLNKEVFPAITLYQPWATWIMRGWKTIETRTHNRFQTLIGKRILIHAGQKTDPNCRNKIDPYRFYNHYLTEEQINLKPHEIINGFILGTAFVNDFRPLNLADSQNALIECETVRFGLFLQDIEPFESPIKEKGGMGIWYYDLKEGYKVYKP